LYGKEAVRSMCRDFLSTIFEFTGRDMVLDTSSLLWGLLFGSVGLGFFLYGKKQRAVVPLACGLALMVLPYFISNILLLVAAGVALIVIPYFISI